MGLEHSHSLSLNAVNACLLFYQRISGSKEPDTSGDFVQGLTSWGSHCNGRHQSNFSHLRIKASNMCRWISQVQWLPVLAHEVSREVKHQQQLFPEVTETPEKESTGATEQQGSSEAPNMGQTDAANATTVAPTEEASGSGDSSESEGSATEGSSESEEEVREKYLI